MSSAASGVQGRAVVDLSCRSCCLMVEIENELDAMDDVREHRARCLPA